MIDSSEGIRPELQELLGAEPDVQELVFWAHRTEVKLTLPNECMLVGEVIRPSMYVPNEEAAFHMINYCVAEGLRGNGIGKKLLRTAAHYATEKGAKIFYGMVQNAAALHVRSSVFGADNMAFYVTYILGGSKVPVDMTFEEVVEADRFPIYVVSDLTKIAHEDE